VRYQRKKEKIINIPNLLTVIRCLLAPIFILSMMNGQLLTTLLLFFVAAATDSLDGLLARHLKSQTEFGKFIDPAADKLLMTTAYVMLTIPNSSLAFTIPLWLTLLVIGRDILIVSGCWALQAFNKRLIIEPIPLGKLCTFSQVLTIFFIILLNLLKADTLIFDISAFITTILTIISGYKYVKSGMIQLEKLA
jgi:cardiolipin synthase